MTNETQRRLMHEALDDVLSPEERNELFSHLDQDEKSFAEFNQLQRVDRVLRNAPHERAPQRLAATIMARLSQTVKSQVQEQLPGISTETLSVALGLVTVATMPMMVSASWMLLNSAYSMELFHYVLQQVIGLLLLIIEVLRVFFDQAEMLVETNPQAAASLLALIPVTLLAMARYLLTSEVQ
jgi:hypothetical protein